MAALANSPHKSLLAMVYSLKSVINCRRADQVIKTNLQPVNGSAAAADWPTNGTSTCSSSRRRMQRVWGHKENKYCRNPADLEVPQSLMCRPHTAQVLSDP
jgi:hypothetical protein